MKKENISKKKRVNTLKDVCNILNISKYKLDKIRFKIIQAYDYAPEFMIHGTNGKKWSLDLFKKYIKANKKCSICNSFFLPIPTNAETRNCCNVCIELLG